MSKWLGKEGGKKGGREEGRGQTSGYETKTQHGNASAAKCKYRTQNKMHNLQKRQNFAFYE